LVVYWLYRNHHGVHLKLDGYLLAGSDIYCVRGARNSINIPMKKQDRLSTPRLSPCGLPAYQ